MTTIAQYLTTPSHGGEGAFGGAEVLDVAEGHEGQVEGLGELSTIGILPPGSAEADAALHIMPAFSETDDSFDSFVGGVEALPPPTDAEELRRMVNEQQHGDNSGGDSSSSSSSDAETSGLPAGVQGTTIFTGGGGGADFLQIIFDAINQQTRRAQLDEAITRVTVNGERVERGLDDKLKNLEKKLNGSDASLAGKVLMWMAMIVGAIVSAISLGLMTGPMAMIAGVIGLVLAVYTIAQQIAVEVTEGAYYPGMEWALAAEAFGMDPEQARQFGEVFNAVIMVVLSILSAALGLGAAFGVGKGATDLAKLSSNMARVAQFGEGASAVTEAGSSASGLATSGISMHNGLIDVDNTRLQAWIEQLGMTKEELIAFVQQLLNTLNKMTELGQEMMEHFFESLQSMTQRPHMV